MNWNSLKCAAPLTFILALSACCPLPPKPDMSAAPSVLTLEQAIAQVQSAIAEARESNKKMDMMLGKVSIVLNVASVKSTKDGGTATIGVELSPLTVGSSRSRENSESVTNGNTITLEFNNPLLAVENTVIGKAAKSVDSMETLKKFLAELSELNVILVPQ